MKLVNKIQSKVDQTVKFQFQTNDYRIVEACVVFFEKKEAPVNICVSTQLGCECSCWFCATGSKRFIRNLSVNEVIKQVELILEDMTRINSKKFEITFMGTGEPLKNKEVVFKSIELFTEQYKNLHRINLSSIFPERNFMVSELQKLNGRIHFQYSLHFLSDENRKKYFRRPLLPIQDALNILDQVASYYNEKYCINYILFENVNDSVEDAKALALLVKEHSAYLKISEYSPVKYCDLAPSKKFDDFIEVINQTGICYKKFASQGSDIHAACGHLLTNIEI